MKSLRTSLKFKILKSTGLSLVELLVAMSMLSGLFLVSSGFVYNLIQQAGQYHKTDSRLAFEKELNALFSQQSLCTCNLGGATPLAIPDTGSVPVNGLRSNCANPTNDFYQYSASGFVRDQSLTVTNISIANASLVSANIYSAPVTVSYSTPTPGQVALKDGRYLLMFTTPSVASPYTISTCFLAPQVAPNPTAWLLGGNAGLTSFNFLGTSTDNDIIFNIEWAPAGLLSPTTTAWGVHALQSNAGAENTAFGSTALQANSVGSGNTAVGIPTLQRNTNGSNNTAVGAWNLLFSTGNENTTVGSGVLASLTSGDGNTALGVNTLSNTSNGSYNTGTGVNILANVQTSYNTAVGGGQINGTTGSSNTSFGHQSLEVDDSGSNNTAFGAYACYTANGTQNICFGAGSMLTGSANASYCTGIGTSTLINNLAGNYNSAFGDSSIFNSNASNLTHFGFGSGGGSTNTPELTSFGTATSNGGGLGVGSTSFGASAMTQGGGQRITAFGAFTLLQLDNAQTDNTSIGYQSLLATFGTGSYLTSVGAYALYTDTTGSNTAVGYQALQSNYNGINNVAVGSQALIRSVMSNNVAVGDLAGYNIYTANSATAVGSGSMGSGSTAFGGNNSGMGRQTLYSLTSGSENLAMGYSALRSDTSGSDNTAIGSNSLYTNDVGSSNVSIGTDSLKGINNGTKNTAIGYAAGEFDSSGASYFNSGSYNTFIGAATGVQNSGSSYSNSTAIGYGATIGANNVMVLGGTGASAVNVGIGVPAPIYQLQLATDSAAKPGTNTWATSSDIRLKDVRGPFTRSLASLEGIQPVYYRYKLGNAMNLPTDKEYVGVVAQNAQANVPESVWENAKGFLNVQIDSILWTMLNSVKELFQLIADDTASIKAEIAKINQAYAELEAQNLALKAKNSAYKAYLCAKDRTAPFCN